MTLSDRILVLGGGSRMAKLAQQVQSLGREPVAFDRIEEAIDALADRPRRIAAGLLSAEYPIADLKGEAKALQRLGPEGRVSLIACGSPADRGTRRRLRSAGVRLALWEPFDDGTLRFQINRALNGDGDDHHRTNARVPTYLLARVFFGDRSRDAVVYSLSVGGAFLETPRAMLAGAHVRIDLRLPSGAMQLESTVLYANVPGNLQRPNLPLGMGVRFVDLGKPERKTLGAYVAERAALLEV